MSIFYREDLELVEYRLRRLVETEPELREMLAESKHLTSMLSTRWHDELFAKRMHQAIDSKNQSHSKFIGMVTAAALIDHIKGFNKKLQDLLLLAERYYRGAAGASSDLDSLKAQASQARRGLGIAWGARNIPSKDANLLMIKQRDQLQRYKAIAEEIQRLLHTSYIKAYAEGVRSSGFPMLGLSNHISADERKWVASAAKQEMQYMRGVLRDIESGRTVNTMLSRIKMYGEALRGVYSAGQVVTLPPNTIIQWKVDPLAKHCQTCLTLQRYGPYTKKTLPTTPGAGATECRSNCRCELENQEVTPEQFQAVEKENRSKDYVLRMIRGRTNRR